MQNFTEIVPGEPLHRELNARGVAKFSDFVPVKGYISEMVQDTAFSTVNVRRLVTYFRYSALYKCTYYYYYC